MKDGRHAVLPYSDVPRKHTPKNKQKQPLMATSDVNQHILCTFPLGRQMNSEQTTATINHEQCKLLST